MKIGDSETVFFSYKSDDVDFVRPICERLLADGRSVWFCEYDVSYDQIDDFQEPVDRGIDEAKWGAIFASDRYAQSRYCRTEAERLLRRLPVDRLFVFQQAESSDFQAQCPQLAGRVVTVRDAEAVFRELHRAGVAAHEIDTVGPSQPNRWWLNAIGAYFDPGPWGIHMPSAWPGRERIVDPMGETLHGCTVLVATLHGRIVHLFVDCGRLEPGEASAASLRRRTTESDGRIHLQPDEQDDRQRLREELKCFGSEVVAVRELMIRRRPGWRPPAPHQEPTYQAIGAHIFDTVESEGGARNAYKHRLFSYRQVGRLYRAYRLCLPQPQLHVPVVVRFVFEFDDELPAFFRTVPLCDRLVKSFTWMTLATQPKLSADDLRAAVARVKGGDQ
jgi:TIR domain